MNIKNLFLSYCIIIISCAVSLAGFEYDVPITAAPTDKVDEQLLGKWNPENDGTPMVISKQDDFHYIIRFENGEMYHAFNSTIDGIKFVSVQEKIKESKKFYYWVYELKESHRLVLKNVNDNIVPDSIPNSETAQKLLKENLSNPALLGEEIVFVRTEQP